MNEIAEYKQTEGALRALRMQYENVVFDVSTTRGMEEARKARASIRGYRTSLEAVRKEIKAPALERCRLIDSEAKRLTAELEALEEPIDAQIKNEELRKEAARIAKQKAEMERVAEIRKALLQIGNAPARYVGKPSEEIARAIDLAESYQITEERFQEFYSDAMQSMGESIQTLKDMLASTLAAEEREARLRAEREAEEARLRAEREAAAERAKVENARIAAENARLAAERAEIENARIAAEREAAAERAKIESIRVDAELIRQDAQRRQAEIDADRDRPAAEEKNVTAADAPPESASEANVETASETASEMDGDQSAHEPPVIVTRYAAVCIDEDGDERFATDIFDCREEAEYHLSLIYSPSPKDCWIATITWEERPN